MKLFDQCVKCATLCARNAKKKKGMKAEDLSADEDFDHPFFSSRSTCAKSFHEYGFVRESCQL